MPSVNDWAAKAAQRILAEYKHKSPHYLGDAQANVAAIIATFAAPLLELIHKRKHYHNGTASWLCCPRCNQGDHHEYEDRAEGACNCGAAEHNAKVDKALRG